MLAISDCFDVNFHKQFHNSAAITESRNYQ